MIIVIPLGGTGERFKKNGYKEPKALIKVFGKPILYYLLNNLNFSATIDAVCIPYNKEYLPYRLEESLRKDYPHINFHFLCLKNNTRGAAETLQIALSSFIEKNKDYKNLPFISLDGDNFYTNDILKLWGNSNRLITVHDVESAPIYSFVKLNGQGKTKIVDIVEKERVSDYICTGAYGFQSITEFLNYSSGILENDSHQQKGEFYISSVIKKMITDGIEFTNCPIERNDWTCLGTPIQIRTFCNNYPQVSCNDNNQCIQKQRICFDLDNTLVTYPKVAKDYTTVEPIQKNIDFLKYLRNFGHTIIIYTARRMKTHEGNAGSAMADVGKITFDTLAKFDIPYDEIYFGKPYAHVYIDDMALNAFDDLEKGTGYYMDSISPRDFNNLQQNSIETITKKSNDLSGEIYYYTHIPHVLKDMFPCLLNFDSENAQWYTMEKISGLPLTSLYLSQLMTETILKNVMNSIYRLQNSVNGCEREGDLNIYANYAEKLEKRYANYDYSRFPESTSKFEMLLSKLQEYQREKKGKCCIIHGDTVMTNIIINKYNKIKFIDMRGKVGDVHTIYGDYLYDWAKLYQSLVGYDEILQDKPLPEKYKESMISFFENYFVELFSKEELEWVKIITKSLYFTLIPLHNNSKCEAYYRMV